MGAYKIEGGANGAALLGLAVGSLAIASVEALVKLPPPLWAGPIIALLGVMAISLCIILRTDDMTRGCFFQGFSTSLAIAGAAMLPQVGFVGSSALQAILAAVGASLQISKITSTSSFLQCFGVED